MFGHDEHTLNGTLPGVSCDVKTCSFNGAANSCHAPGIKVENPNAHKKQETLCGTYDEKSGM